MKPLFSNSIGAKAWFAALAKATRLAGIALVMLVGTLWVPNTAMAQGMGTRTPSNLVVAPGNGSVALSWDYEISDSYVLTATASGQTTRTCSVGDWDRSFNQTATCTVSPLTNGVTYTLSLVATERGTPSSPATVNATPGAPSAPTGVTTVGGDRSATVSWAASFNNGTVVTGYTVQFGSGSTAETAVTAGTCASASSSTATSCTVTGLSNGTAYLLSVAALSAWGPSPVGISNPQAVVPATVSYTGTDQTYTVPAGMTSLNVVVTGGAGGSDGPNGSHAGIVTTTLTGLAPGQVLTVKVGGAGGIRTYNNGTGAAGGTYGGATGGTASGSGTTNTGGFGGGGYSAVYSGSTALVVAGGGGGGSSFLRGGSVGADGLGGAGGSGNGSPGGGGGAAGAGGSGGVLTGHDSMAGSSGSALAGGAGGAGVSTNVDIYADGGNGGGGGWFGGGGGSAGYYDFGGGGGAGSSYADPTQTSGATYSQVSTLDSNYLRSGSVQIMFITAPTATSINPTSGVTSGGTSVTVAGTGFVTGATVTVGGVVCTSPNVVSATSLTCTTGAGAAGAANVVVSNADSQSGTLTSGFTYVAPATYSVTYNANTSTGGSVPTDGATYANGATVTVLGNSGTLVKTGYTFDGWNTLANGTGTAQAAASTFTMGGAAVTLYAQWTLIPAPTVTAISPSSGPLAGGTNVTITGTGFTGATGVTMGGQAGIEWTSRSSAADNEWWGLVYGNGLFVAVSFTGTNRVMTSPDGVTWTSRTAPTAYWREVAYGNGVYVAVGANAVMTSPDGVTWTSQTPAVANDWLALTYGNGLFVALSQPGNVMTSPDGVTWTSRTPAVTGNQWRRVGYGNGLFVAVADYGANRVMTSSNGINWTSRTSADSSIDWYATAYGNGLWVVTGSGDSVMTSSDGTTWTKTSAPGLAYSSYISYGSGLFVATKNGAVSTSPDGINWTSRPVANNWYGVTYGNGQFVAVAITGSGNRVMTSGPPAATGVTVVSDTSITATSPAGSAGTASVLVTTAAGTNAANTLYTYVAPATYSVTYDGNTSTGGSVPTDGATYANGASVTVLGNTGTLVKTGYTFNGWNTLANGTGTAQAAASTFAMGGAAVTLYAQWTLIPTYSVTYNANTSTGGSVPTDAGAYANGATVTVLGNTGTLVKTGYTFNGWNTAADGSGTAQAAASTFTMGGAAVTLYAQWTLIPAPTYSVTYNANTSTGGSVPTDGNTYVNGATVTVLGNSGSLAKTGYTFNGWNTLANGAGTAQAAASTFTMGGAAVTLYAQWTLIAAPTVTSQTFAYVPNTGSDTVTVINTSNNTVAATVAVGSGPFGAAVNAAGTFVYVTNAGGNTVSVIDTTSNTVATTVTVGANPQGVAVNAAGTFAYVANNGSGDVSVINTANNTVAATVNVGTNPVGVAINSAGTFAYVTNYRGNTVSVISTANNTVVATVNVGSNPYGLAVNPVGTVVYVVNNGSGNVSVIDTSNNTVSATLAGGGFGVAINPTGTRAYVARGGADTVAVIDTATNLVVATVNGLSYVVGIAVNPAGTFAYVANDGNNTVGVIDTATNLVVATVPVGLYPISLGSFVGNTSPVNPASGPASGGTSVTIAGTGFTGATGVTIGGAAATSVTVLSDTSITATTPAGSAGTASVLVTTAAGTNAANTLYTYVAPATYSVTYDGNTSTGGSVPTDGATYANGATVTVLGNTGSLAKTGYTFNGWNTLANGTGTAQAAASTFTMGGAAVTLYAQWTLIPTYSVTYNANTSTGGSVPTDSATYANGASVTVLGNSGTLVKTGYTFNGWNTLANGGGTAQAAASTFTMGGTAVTLYAQWTLIAAPTYGVTYNGNASTGGSVPADGATYANGASVTVLGNTGTLVKSGYTFNGWNTAADGSGTAQAVASTFTMGGAAVTLHAQWTLISAPTYSVTYNGNSSTGGSVPTDGTTYANGAPVTVLGNSGTLVRTGHTFNGWNTLANGGGTARAAASTFAMGGAAVTLYAKWTTAAVNGACATVAATAFMPVSGLCTTGTASAVSAASPWAWTCTGSGGGTPASCSAPNASTATGSGSARASISGGRWVVDAANSGFVASSTVPSLPPGTTLPHGLLNLKLTGGGLGASATVVITYPSALPAGTVYWKYGRTASNTTAHWYQFAGAVVSGSTITLTLTDGADGDDDMTANGVITDPGGPGAPASTTVEPIVPEVPVPLIPPLASLPALPGVGNSGRVFLNLGEGAGPVMTGCLRTTLNDLLGADWLYQGQSADGGARLSRATEIISFYPIEANTNTTYGLGQGAGIYLRTTNPLSVVTGCGTFLTAPALYSLGEFGALLNAAGQTAQINAQGVITYPTGSLTYAVRPDYLVTQGTPGAPALTTGADGQLRFTDSAGHVQILYPAFLEPETLGNQVAQAVGGWTVIQTDGTALVTLLNGQKFVLTPDLALGTVPPEIILAAWWQDGPNHYRFRHSGFSNTSQGFSVSPR